MKLSNSKLNSFRACPRKFFYEYIASIEPIEEGESEHDRSFGAAIHMALESLYKGGSVEQAKVAFDLEYPKQLDLEDFEKTPENGKKLIEAYWMQYASQMKDWKVLAVEVLDEYEPIDGLVFRVKLDLIAENLKYGGVYGFDHKTTGKKLDYRYWSQFNPNAQISTYFDYITKKYGSCAGFYIDAMSFGFRKRKYKEEPAGFHYQLDRQLFTQTKDQLADWLESEREWGWRLHDAIDRKKFPMDTRSCQYCSYRPICAAGWSWETDRELIECQYQLKEKRSEVSNDKLID